MGETSKPAFPQTPDGVTDWEKVFEDPANGLIAAVQRANSADALRQIMLVIIRQLFTRKNDELQVAQLTRQLEDLLSGADGALPTDAAVGLLRMIKEERKAKAQAYLEEKAKGKETKNRRSESGKSKFIRILYVILKNPKYLIGAAVGLLVVLAGVIAVVLFSSISPEEQEIADQTRQEGEVAAGAKPGGAPAKPAAPPKADMPLPTYEEPKPVTAEALVLRHVTLPRSLGRWAGGPSHVLPFIIIRDRKYVSTVCRQLPYVLSTINVELSDAFKDIDKFDEQVLAQVGRQVVKILNYKLNDRPVVQVHLAIPQNSRDNAPGKCSLMPEKLKKYLQ